MNIRVSGTGALLSLVTGVALAGGGIGGPMAFEPLQGSVEIGALPAAAPLALPPGFRQRIVADESDLDIYPGMPDWNDMNTVNENGARAGRYLYRTHEVRPSRFGSRDKYFSVNRFINKFTIQPRNTAGQFATDFVDGLGNKRIIQI